MSWLFLLWLRGQGLRRWSFSQLLARPERSSFGEVAFLVLDGRDVSAGAVQPCVVVPVHPLQRGELDLLDRLPRPTPADQLRLVQADRRLRQRIVISVADRADRAVDARVDQPLSEGETRILTPGI